MSKDLYPLYPSNSRVIDLRSKIINAPMSKTKQFFNELQRKSGSSPTKTTLHMKRAYESERWFTPRIDTEEADTSAPPRRSMFTPSRLQLLSAQRGREMRKPYWRCPMPATKSSETQVMPTLSEIITTPTVRQGPIKQFRRREPETGIKTNSFVVDEDILTVEEKEKEELMNKVQLSGMAPKAGFLGPSSLEDLFTFADPIVRGPRLGMKEIATQTDQDSTTTSLKTVSPQAFKAVSYGVVNSSSVPSSEPKSTFGGFVAGRANDLAAPVGVVAETISCSQIRLSWTNSNPNAFNQIYTIKYGISNSDEAQHMQLNSTETEHTFDGLRPDSQYEFAVRLAQSDQWSLSAVTRTLSAPPSSPPRDLTVVDPQLSRQQQGNGDSTMVTLAWQPPKYTNGDFHAPNPVHSGGFTFGAAPPAGGPFQFGTAPPAVNGNTFQFGTAPPVANGNSYQFSDSSESASASVRHGVPVRKLLAARRKKR